MAVVDFTNAKIQVANTFSKPPVGVANANLYNANLKNSSGNTISSGSISIQSQTANKFVFQYVGTFTASGTEFLMYNVANPYTIWKVSNISFQNGDTYSFYIPITIN